MNEGCYTRTAWMKASPSWR